MKKLLIVLFVSLLLCGCGNDHFKEMKKIMDENEHIIVDVRTSEEYRQSHVVGSVNIPYDEINENSIIEKDKVIFVYCKSGGRSSIAYSTLKSMGYTVYDLGAISTIDLPKE